MDGAGGLEVSFICGAVWRQEMGLYSKGFRFEGGGRHLIGNAYLGMMLFETATPFNHPILYVFVVGLNRTGKSCRLRWVNYLHPGLKRGKLTPFEEKLVLDLHSKWGNRWSRIARKLPGRTDNEIKNYFRTHMRKKAQEEKRALASPSSSSCHSSLSSNNNNNQAVDSHASKKAGEESFYDTGGPVMTVDCSTDLKEEEGFSMDDIWKDIELCEEKNIVVYDGNKSEEGCNFSSPPSWEYSSDPLWVMDEQSVLFPTSDPYFSSFLTG